MIFFAKAWASFSKSLTRSSGSFSFTAFMYPYCGGEHTFSQTYEPDEGEGYNLEVGEVGLFVERGLL